MILKLYKNPLPASRTGALYNAFSYPTKISPEAIAIFIATHTNPGDAVLDTFSGSGTTGLATLLCDTPTDAMLKMSKDLGVSPKWGPRKAHLFDVGVLGCFVADTLCHPPSSTSFLEATQSFFLKANEKLKWMYEALDQDKNEGFIRHVIWSDVIQCSHCDKEFPFFDVCIQFEPLSFLDVFNCPSCKNENIVKKCDKSTEFKVDGFTGDKIEKRKRVPSRIYGQSGKVKWQRKPTTKDIELINKINELPFISSMPNKKIVWGDLHRAGYHKGITHLHDFYTRRNFHVMSTLWELTNEYDENVRATLQLLILSYNASHSTLMTRVVAKKSQKDFVLTGAQSGVLYVSSLPVEKNIIVGLTRKAVAFEKAFSLIRNSSSSVMVKNTSSEKLPLPNGSIDYVFTDPPFGDYIPYAELNQINELWLKSVTDRNEEIIVSKALNKGVEQYGEMMKAVFSEIERVLKPQGNATVVFHSAKSVIWQALTNAYSNVGLKIRFTSVLDKLQSSFKQTNSIISVKGDPLLLLVKGEAKELCNLGSKRIMDQILSGLNETSECEKTPERLYSRYVNLCLESEIQVDVDAIDFYAEAKKILGE